MIELSTHLTFAGRCEEAFRFYVDRLGATGISLFRYRDAPGEHPDGWADKIVHGSVHVGDHLVSGADVEAAHPMSGFHLLLTVGGADEARRVFDVLAEGGSVKMPLAKTFWSPAFGVVVDRFGVPWEVSSR